jgi:hypothetical protein
MARQAKTLAYASASRAVTLPAVQLATLLAHLTPGDLSCVLFSSGGSEAVESALKITRQYHTLRGEPERYKVIARRGSYHGATYGAMSVSGAPRSVDPYYSPLVPGALTVSAPYCYRCDYRKTYPACEVYCVDAIEDLIAFENPRSVAAVIAEPVSAACGVVVPPPEYLPSARRAPDPGRNHHRFWSHRHDVRRRTLGRRTRYYDPGERLEQWLRPDCRHRVPRPHRPAIQRCGGQTPGTSVDVWRPGRGLCRGAG